MVNIPRYLIDFDLRKIPAYYTDVLVIGSGIAGLSAALTAARDADVIVVAKGELSTTNTAYAKGGIAAVLSREDSFDLHFADTMKAAQEIADPQVVRRVIMEGPQAIEDLIRWGVQFDRSSTGDLDLGREGAHSRPRIAHAMGASTGQEIQRALTQSARGNERISVFEKVMILDLLTNEEGECIGALGWSEENGLVALGAHQTILATGGGGQIYRETSNPEIATADGQAMAFRAGAKLRDLEFVQFHPTALYIAGAARVLVSEVLRGAGGILRDRNGTAFMNEFHPDAELASRDIVARAITRVMARTQDTHVDLDLSRVEGDVLKRFPQLAEICRFFDIDIRKNPIPVRPAAHYFIGGIAVDLETRTTIPRLLACGEATSSGLHGANRLGSNSLLEGIVFGKVAGQIAASECRGIQPQLKGKARQRTRKEAETVGLHLEDMTYSLKSVMGRDLGVERSAEGMDQAVRSLEFWGRYLFRIVFRSPRGWELANMLTVAQLVALAAQKRTESRGVHYRIDAPERNDERWLCHLCAIRDRGEPKLTMEPIQSSFRTTAS